MRVKDYFLSLIDNFRKKLQKTPQNEDDLSLGYVDVEIFGT